jgi:hypothetical protein
MRKVLVRKSVIEGAAEELDRLANDIYESNTLDGVWGCDDSKQEYDHLIILRDQLQAALKEAQ